MNITNNTMKTLKNIAVSLLIIGVTSCTNNRDIPKELHGFWQFKVTKKGQWNGMHIGKNYVELNYDLASLEEIKKIDKGYALKVSNGKDTTNIQVEMLPKDSAVFKVGKDQIYRCKKYDFDPNIKKLNSDEYAKLFENKNWFEKYKDVKTPFKISTKTIELDNKEWNIIWFGEYLKKEYRALLERNGNYQLVYITFYNGKEEFKLVYNQGDKLFTTKLTDDRSLYLASNTAYFSSSSETKNVESISIDFEVKNKIPNHIKVCVSPIFASLNKRSLQMAISSQTERIVKKIVGKDTICDTEGLLSIFGTQNLKLGKTVKGGVKFSGTHDGAEYVTIRNKIKWDKGKYRVKLFKSGYTKGKRLPADSIKFRQTYSIDKYEHTWFTMTFENLENGKKWTVGSVAISGKEIRVYNDLWFFVEIYRTPINFIGKDSELGLFYKDIPAVKVVYKNLKINDKKVFFDKIRVSRFNKELTKLGRAKLNSTKDAIECEIGYQE